MLAKGCLCANPDKPSSEDLDIIKKFCHAYCNIMEDQWSVIVLHAYKL